MSAKSPNTNELGAGDFFSPVVHRTVLHGTILTQLHMPHGRRFPVHAHARPYLCMITQGEYCEQYRREVSFMSPYTAAFRPAGHPHQDEVGSQGASFFGVELSAALAASLFTISDDRAPAALGLEASYDCLGGELSALTRRLYASFRTSQDSLTMESLVAEITGVLGRIKVRSDSAPKWLSAVTEKLHSDFRECLTLEQIASAAEIHPVHASRVFRRFMGQGIGEYRQRLRIRAACEALADCEQTISDISAALGFADQSHFTRVFSAHMGITPGQFRTNAV